MKSVTVAILVLAAVVLIEGERINSTLASLDDTFYQHYNRPPLPGQER